MIGIKSSTLRAPARAPHAPRTIVRAEPINPDIKKDEPKVVDMVNTDDMPKKVCTRVASVFVREFFDFHPLCDLYASLSLYNVFVLLPFVIVDLDHCRMENFVFSLR